MIPRVEPEGMLFRKPVPTFRDHVLTLKVVGVIVVVVHPEAGAEQVSASSQRTKAFGGVARQCRHGQQLYRLLPQAPGNPGQTQFPIGT
jgi:hypothetical protein